MLVPIKTEAKDITTIPVPAVIFADSFSGLVSTLPEQYSRFDCQTHNHHHSGIS
jgi:hypothetical protein